MPDRVDFTAYQSSDRESCRSLFDANCPGFFAPNERRDYIEFLDGSPSGYEICRLAGTVVGGYGISHDPEGCGRLSWILLDPDRQGTGIGRQMMERSLAETKRLGFKIVQISASQHSAPFFQRFGATVVAETPNGWGPGMHRVEMFLEPGQL